MNGEQAILAFTDRADQLDPRLEVEAEFYRATPEQRLAALMQNWPGQNVWAEDWLAELEKTSNPDQAALTVLEWILYWQESFHKEPPSEEMWMPYSPDRGPTPVPLESSM